MSKGENYEIDRNNVEVRVSTIPNAGNGLFAKKAFKKGDYICSYEGPIISLATLSTKSPEEASYMLQHAFDTENGGTLTKLLDAGKQDSFFGRYCNDPIFPNLYNIECDLNSGGSRLTKRKRWGVIDMLAKKAVKTGDEIFFNYGFEYWMEIKRTNVLNTDQIDYLKDKFEKYKDWLLNNFRFDETQNKYKVKNKKRPVPKTTGKLGTKSNPIPIDEKIINFLF